MSSADTTEHGQNGDSHAPSKQAETKWYKTTIPAGIFIDTMRRILREYSNVPEEQLEPHVYDIRDQAWSVLPYFCIGHFTFLEVSIGQAPEYDDVLQRFKDGESLLDLGCCFGQDVRKLVFDGAPAANIYATDTEPRFFDLGYKLFHDEDSLKSTFIAADICNDSAALDGLEGTLGLIHASSIFHLFDYDTQVRIAKRCVRLLKRQPGCLIFGRQAGNVRAGVFETRIRPGEIFRHNEESWKKMWTEVVGPATGTRWKVDARLYEHGFTGPDEGVRRMRFAMVLEE